MNPFTKALQNAVDKVSGITRVNNATNPLSANARMTASVGKRNLNDPQNPANKFQFATKQQTFGVPGDK